MQVWYLGSATEQACPLRISSWDQSDGVRRGGLAALRRPFAVATEAQCLPPPQQSVPQQLSTASLAEAGWVVAWPWRAR